MVNAKVLLMSDDRETARIWCYALQQAGFETVTIPPTEKGDTERRPEALHDLIIIDVHAPHYDRAYLVKRMRDDATVPILVLTYIQDENLILQAYEAGADEVMPGSISFKLLLAKVNAWLRRSWTVPTSLLESTEVGSMRLDTANRQIIKTSGEQIRLTGLEFRLVHILMRNTGQVMPSSLLIDRIWGGNGGGDSNLLKTLIYRVRRKIEPDPTHPRFIQAVAGEGYVFVSQ